MLHLPKLDAFNEIFCIQMTKKRKKIGLSCSIDAILHGKVNRWSAYTAALAL
jgi:hypothetical protein